jgi:5-methylcytosine-specific restriction protein A
MAVTQGHGNPNWTREEVILALDLYQDCGEAIPSKGDKRVRALSELLRSLPYHRVAARKESFRNADGVAFKLQNLRQVATGKGLGNVAIMDREVWNDLGLDRERTKQLAALIRSTLDEVRGSADDSDDDEEFFEGRLVTKAHVRRERNPKVRAHLIRLRKNKGLMRCDVCSCAPKNAMQEAIFEAHHVVPLSAAHERNTRIRDMALLCANCHRMVHRAIGDAKHCLSVEDAKQRILELDQHDRAGSGSR